MIESLPADPAIYRDSDLIGFAVRVQKTYKTYIVEKKVNGRAVRHTLGIVGQLTLPQARQKASETLALMGQGINPNDQKRQEQKAHEHERELNRQHPTLSDAYNAFLSERALKANTLHDYNKVITKYLADWQDKKLADITRKMVQDKHKSLTENSPAQANMAMRVFRAVYNFAVEHYLDDDENPLLPAISPTKTLTAKKAWNKIKRKKTYINEDKMPDWVKAVVEFENRGQSLETNKDFLLTLILTGFRRSECESIAWSAIDLKYGFIHPAVKPRPLGRGYKAVCKP
ncbi:integrase arm-type DNA-binding domain-containing protein [Moraxella caviae]|uniref:integrase arm-type DNA-binding domain-containing protein n=1 Tax=Moraxella caviae TaxID=34060 RepID=UPI001FE5CD78|nr:integrase arm-type DNA-binding domain-containing protein [Moraxella caviae]